MSKNGNEIEDIMKNLDSPTVDVHQHQQEFRLTLLNTKKSAIVGALLLVLPLLFLSGVILKHYLHIDFGLFTSVYEWIGRVDQKYGDCSVLNWIIRILLLFGPLAAIAINFLSILHVRYEKTSREIVMSIKLKWMNWLIIAVCSTIFFVFLSYLVLENMS